MRHFILSAVAAVAFSFAANAQSVTPEINAPAVPAAPLDHQAATHDNTGVGVKGHHPVHGKIHGHKDVHKCFAHCQEHHAGHPNKDELVKECHKLCDEHHAAHPATNPSGFKGANNPRK